MPSAIIRPARTAAPTLKWPARFGLCPQSAGPPRDRRRKGFCPPDRSLFAAALLRAATAGDQKALADEFFGSDPAPVTSQNPLWERYTIYYSSPTSSRLWTRFLVSRSHAPRGNARPDALRRVDGRSNYLFDSHLNARRPKNRTFADSQEGLRPKIRSIDFQDAVKCPLTARNIQEEMRGTLSSVCRPTSVPGTL